jgi:hypothetical protein
VVDVAAKVDEGHGMGSKGCWQGGVCTWRGDAMKLAPNRGSTSPLEVLPSLG